MPRLPMFLRRLLRNDGRRCRFVAHHHRHGFGERRRFDGRRYGLGHFIGRRHGTGAYRAHSHGTPARHRPRHHRRFGALRMGGLSAPCTSTAPPLAWTLLGSRAHPFSVLARPATRSTTPTPFRRAFCLRPLRLLRLKATPSPTYPRRPGPPCSPSAPA